MFGEDAGLQRLGRGKGNVWSYQNSKESTGAMRDASGQLLKAPNLSNYRKVSVCFRARGWFVLHRKSTWATLMCSSYAHSSLDPGVCSQEPRTLLLTYLQVHNLCRAPKLMSTKGKHPFRSLVQRWHTDAALLPCPLASEHPFPASLLCRRTFSARTNPKALLSCSLQSTPFAHTLVLTGLQ
eukprot:1142300-Pelagomonas_calceolata.AAC.1